MLIKLQYRNASSKSPGAYSITKFCGRRLFEARRLFEGGAYITASIVQVIIKVEYKKFVTYSYLQALFIAQLQ